MTRPKSKGRFNYRVSLYNLQLMLLQIGHRSIFTNHNPQHPQMQLVQNKPKALAKMIKLFHTPHDLSQDQCCSKIVKMIDAPLPLVWSVVRRFEKPQAYKQFVKNCTLSSGDGTAVGSVREVVLVSGLPAERSTERLDRLDDDLHLMMVSIIGGDHKLINYQSTTTLHEDDEGNGDKTVLIESYVVDIPVDSCREDTCFFADTIIGYNLGSLAKVTEKMACQILP